LISQGILSSLHRSQILRDLSGMKAQAAESSCCAGRFAAGHNAHAAPYCVRFFAG